MNRPPGPRGRAVFGFFGGGKPGRMVAFLQNTARRYGPISSFRLLHQHIYVVDDPALIQEILVTRQHEFIRDTGATLLRELIGDGLLTREEPLHRERRRVLQPAFHRTQISSYAADMVSESVQTAAAWKAGASIDAGKEMRRLTLSIVGRSLFGTDFQGSADRIAVVLQKVLHRSRWLGPGFMVLEPLALQYRKWFPHGRSLFFQKERAELEQVILPIVAQRRAKEGNDVVSLMLHHLSDSDIANEIVTFVLAGHETTATALTWAWYLIARHPQVEQKLHAELDTVLGDREPTLDDLPQLRYTGQVFTETLRLYPPAIAFGRRPKEELELGGYTVPKGASILLSPYITQRNEKFFPHPEEFEPERWETADPPKFAYFPFGGGAKMCIGDGFARMEGVLALAAIAQRWRLVLEEKQEIGIDAALTLRPERPVLLRPEPRIPAGTAEGFPMHSPEAVSSDSGGARLG